MRSFQPFVLLALTACSAWSEVPRPWTISSLGESPKARATLADGSRIVVATPNLSLSSSGLLLAGDVSTAEGKQVRHTIDLDEVVRLEIVKKKPDFGSVLLGSLVGDAVIGLLVGGIVAGIRAF